MLLLRYLSGGALVPAEGAVKQPQTQVQPRKVSQPTSSTLAVPSTLTSDSGNLGIWVQQLRIDLCHCTIDLQPTRQKHLVLVFNRHAEGERLRRGVNEPPEIARAGPRGGETWSTQQQEDLQPARGLPSPQPGCRSQCTAAASLGSNLGQSRPCCHEAITHTVIRSVH